MACVEKVGSGLVRVFTPSSTRTHSLLAHFTLPHNKTQTTPSLLPRHHRSQTQTLRSLSHANLNHTTIIDHNHIITAVPALSVLVAAFLLRLHSPVLFLPSLPDLIAGVVLQCHLRQHRYCVFILSDVVLAGTVLIPHCSFLFRLLPEISEISGSSPRVSGLESSRSIVL
ncbi:hypothetical protein RND81_10G044000 [Saponaria officinalis]|uniref:Uncharacterized protein n=1 Tax=Saponaria officinalis TaxID=3572 RepID=A0AAW1HYB8_SAPOF